MSDTFRQTKVTRMTLGSAWGTVRVNDSTKSPGLETTPKSRQNSSVASKKNRLTRAGERLLADSSPLFSKIQTVFADAGHESRKLAKRLMEDAGWKLQITETGPARFSSQRVNVDRGTELRLVGTESPI
jgi:hypothetical protein